MMKSGHVLRKLKTRSKARADALKNMERRMIFPYPYDGCSFADLSGSYSALFEDSYTRFPYLGAREQLTQVQAAKNGGRKLIETLATEVNLTPILNGVSQLLGGHAVLPKIKTNELAEKLIAIMDDRQNAKTIDILISEVQKQCEQEDRWFYSISPDFGKAISKADPAILENKVVVLNASLVHKSAIAQYNPNLAQTVEKAPIGWLMMDVPPHCTVPENRKFDGKMIYLKADEEFNALFDNHFPLDTELGWCPYVRVTGFLKDLILTVITIEYRLPKASAVYSIVRLLQEGSAKKSDLALRSYMLPLMAKAHNIANYTATNDEKAAVRDFLRDAGDDLPIGTRSWYDRQNWLN